MQSKPVAIRVDASVEIGSGHVMRCLTLADELKKRGAIVSFLCRELSGNLIGLIESKGFKVYRLVFGVKGKNSKIKPTKNAVHEISWREDADAVVKILGTNPKLSWMIVDNYALDARWESKIRACTQHIMVIDDLADRLHDCDLLLDQNLYDGTGNRYEGILPEKCISLLGPRYALLRPEFLEIRQKIGDRDRMLPKIFVFFGGCDSTNETEKAMTAIQTAGFDKVRVDVVVGAGNPRRNVIKKKCDTIQNFNFHCQIENMAELMEKADLAIGAGGSTVWERCAVGLPSLVIAVAENQIQQSVTAARHGLLFYLGFYSTVSTEKLSELLRVISCYPEMMRAFEKKGMALVDAKGTQRVADHLMSQSITLRRARPEDCDSMLEWRNDEETRRHIFETTLISPDDHRSWYNKAITNPDCLLLIGEIDNQPIGVLRFDLKADKAIVSVYLVPSNHGRGIGTQLIRSGTLWLKKNQPEVKLISARVLSNNKASLTAFKKAGYHEHYVTLKEVLS